jgi:hypothetical protein
MAIEMEGAPALPGAEEGSSIDQRERDETLAVATTSVAAVATAWAAFEATVWDGRCTFALVHADRQRQLSTEARLEGDQQVAVDVNLFVSWAAAFSGGNQQLADFLESRLPARLKAPLDAWLATKPRMNKEAPPHPFAMPEYRVDAHERALALGKQADESIAEGQRANKISDTYVLFTVVFASIILLSSLAARLHRPIPRRALIVLSSAALLATLFVVALSPIAWVE